MTKIKENVNTRKLIEQIQARNKRKVIRVEIGDSYNTVVLLDPEKHARYKSIADGRGVTVRSVLAETYSRGTRSVR
jgi:hypothetical protein